MAHESEAPDPGQPALRTVGSGMYRRVDDLGRIVVPVEMRRMFGILAGDPLEIAVDGDAIVLRKVESRCVFCGGTDARLRPYRGKRVCERCAADLARPPEDDGG